MNGSFDTAKKSGQIEELENATSPADPTPAQKAAVMRYYVNNAMERLGGSKALQTLPNREVAAAFADALVRFGPNGGADLIRAALVERMERNGREFPIEYKTARESRIGPNPFADLKDLLKDQKEIGLFLESLQSQRDKKVKGSANEKGEYIRNQHFRYEALYP